jgi:DNA helicase II / ATP-dependent DNA helicase PcrA
MMDLDESTIPDEEERLLERVTSALQAAAPRAASRRAHGADDELIALRDEIGEARLEDVPALVAQMERLQEVSLTRAEQQSMLVDPRSPYFGHLRLRESIPGRGSVVRDVLVGRASFTDPKSRVYIVDWRNAPVSQLYYCYSEGGDYQETFGEREVEGEILARRTLTIVEGELVRIASPQGVWCKVQVDAGGKFWQRSDVPSYVLAGGERMAVRPAPRRGVLGSAPAAAQRLDRHLPEITALIDPRQFEIMTSPNSGVVVIQGGAGSGKTTIGLHRLAYLSFAQPDRFPAKRMAVVTQGPGLAAYIGEVLPSLGVSGVKVLTYKEWAERELRRTIPWLAATVTEEVLPAVTRVKSHPALLSELERRARHATGKRGRHAVVELWADLLTDRGLLTSLLHGDSGSPLCVSAADIEEAHRIMVTRTSAITSRDPRESPPERKRPHASRRAHERARREELEEIRAWTSLGPEEGPKAKTVDADLPEHVRRVEVERDEIDDDENVRGEIGIDGQRTEDDLPILDVDDLAILLRASQLLRREESPLSHLFVDEAQDLSPMRLAALIGKTTGDKRGGAPRAPSVTLAGDTAQRLFLDNGFGDWKEVLGHLGLAHVAVEPLRIGYRSTREILDLARFAMGPLPIDVPSEAKRSGAPVEAFRFSAVGAAVAFLAEALRDLAVREPRATVALLARYPEQADRYHEGLRRAEVASLRRVRVQDFSFRPGIDVTDVRQVKGLEYDYVILLDANASSYSTDDESRHLFHIAATRAAHQLWLVATARPSPLIPAACLRD